MKSIRIILAKWLEKQDKGWRALPPAKQRRYTLCFFLAYLLLTAAVVTKACCDMADPDGSMVIRHIDSPVRKKESPASRPDILSTIAKETIYERK